MKYAVIIFHKNIKSYPKRWIEKCFGSIRNQTRRDFDVFEIDYGGTENQAYEGSIFESKPLPTHAHAHNYLLDKVFSMGYDYIFNTNVDDFYSPERFEKQLAYIHTTKARFDMVSSNFYNVDENDNVTRSLKFNHLNIAHHFSRGHNIIAHPACCYSKRFWESCSKLNPLEIPIDDFELWRRSIRKGANFYILPDFLLYYRVHKNKICNQ